MRWLCTLAAVVLVLGCGGPARRRVAAESAATDGAADPQRLLRAHRALDAIGARILESDETGRLTDLYDLRAELSRTVEALGGEAGLPAAISERVAHLTAAIERREIDVQRRALALQAGLGPESAAPQEAADGPESPEQTPVTRPEDLILRWPLAKLRVTSPFGTRMGVFTHEDADRVTYHDGLDLGAPRGEPVRACGPGTVVFAGEKGGYGLMVSIDHGAEVFTHYAHLAAADVEVGQRVVAGELIALVGSSGRTTGPHLHLMVTAHGRKMDPSDAIGVPIGSLEPPARGDVDIR